MGRDQGKTAGMANLCLAGGVAVNCVANGKLLRDGSFKRIWVQPAAGDAGGALGAAFAALYDHLGAKRKPNGKLDAMSGAYLGPSFSNKEIERRLKLAGAKYAVLNEAELIARTVKALAEGKAVGWVSGRAELGPPAPGHRQVPGDPRRYPPRPWALPRGRLHWLQRQHRLAPGRARGPAPDPRLGRRA